jgi:cysteine desulfurase
MTNNKQTQRIYLDHAASTPMNPAVLEAMTPYLLENCGNPSSIHYHGRELRSAVERARRTIADVLNVAPSEIVFTSGGTEADNFALKCACRTHHIERVITSPLEHHAVLHPAQMLAKAGEADLHLVNVHQDGTLDYAHLEELLQDSRPTLVSLMHGNNETGVLNDLERIGELCAESGALFHSDTVQTIGLRPMEVESMPTHYITAAAHKFNGPRGVGFLYVRSGHALAPHIHGGAQERNQRAGTENVAGIVGMAKALELVHEKLEEKRRLIGEIKTYMAGQLIGAIPGIEFNSPRDGGLESVLNVALPGTEEEGSMLLMNLDIRGISASGGSACTSGSVKGSHVLAAMGLDDRRIANSIRFSFGAETTKSDIDRTVQVLCEIIPDEVTAEEASS